MKLLQNLEAALVRGAFGLFRALPPAAASNVGGALARTIGPLLPVSRVAHANLSAAMPELDETARRRIVRGVWENLGRTLGEWPHLGDLRRTASGPGYEVQGEDIIKAVAGGPALLVSAHIGNWEMLPPICATYGVRMSSLYRAPSNPMVDATVAGLRQRAMTGLAGGEAPRMFPKGTSGARAAASHLARGGYVGMLMDQKLNDGIEARLFGLKAMTAPAAAAFAVHFRCPLYMGHVERLGPARLRLVVCPVLPMPQTGNRRSDTQLLTQTMNDEFERWIRARPESWLWLHRRWPKDVVRRTIKATT